MAFYYKEMQRYLFLLTHSRLLAAYRLTVWALMTASRLPCEPTSDRLEWFVAYSVGLLPFATQQIEEFLARF